jgi:WD40 repeat protein
VWDLRTGATLSTLTGDKGSVHAVACTELDGAPVAVTGSDDQTGRVWDLRAGATLTGPRRCCHQFRARCPTTALSAAGRLSESP